MEALERAYVWRRANTRTCWKFLKLRCIARLLELYHDESGHHTVHRLSRMCSRINLMIEYLSYLEACIIYSNDSTLPFLTHFDGTTLRATRHEGQGPSAVQFWRQGSDQGVQPSGQCSRCWVRSSRLAVNVTQARIGPAAAPGFKFFFRSKLVARLPWK